MTDEYVNLAEAIAEDADTDAEGLVEEIEKLREHKVPTDEIERSLRRKYDAYEYADIEIPVTGGAVGVRTTTGALIIGRAVTPAKDPNDLFTIAAARIGNSLDDLSRSPDGCDAPGVREQDGHMEVFRLDHRYSPPDDNPALDRFGGVIAIESGPVVDPRDLLGREVSDCFEVNL
jgi:hypothetical protein